MRLTQKKIEEIMLSILGEEGLSLVKELSGKQHVSEFELADKLKKDIKIVRKMLYLLYNHNLVNYILLVQINVCGLILTKLWILSFIVLNAVNWHHRITMQKELKPFAKKFLRLKLNLKS